MLLSISSSRPALRTALALTIASLLLSFSSGGASALGSRQVASGSSLQFFGTAADGLDRVRIPLGPLSAGRLTASYPVNVAGDFTVEFWMKATAGENSAPACGNGWYYGNIIIDRDVDGAGDHGDYGVALCDGRIAAGVSVGEDDRQLTSDLIVADGQWHHVALTRTDGGQIALFVDGARAGSAAGPSGQVDYRVGRETGQPESDPFLVLGAEKHLYPDSAHYAGLLDDLRISNIARYGEPFTPPREPHPADANTVALYRFDEGGGNVVGDRSGAAGGPSDGALITAGVPLGPAWSSDTPFAAPAGEPTAAEATAAPPAVPTQAPEATQAPATTESAPTAAPAATAPAPTQAPATTESAPTALPTSAGAAPSAPGEPSPVVVADRGAAALDTPTAQAAGGAATHEAPPPASSMDALLFAWLSAAAVIAIAVFIGVRRRTGG